MKVIIALKTVVTGLELIKENKIKNSELKSYILKDNRLILIHNKTKYP
jgi:hypothetical protein